MDDIEEWSGCSYIQLKEIYVTRQGAVEKKDNRVVIMSPTVIDDGRLVSERVKLLI